MAPVIKWKDGSGNWILCDTPEKSRLMHLDRIRKRHEALVKEGFMCTQGWRMNIGTEHATLLDGGIRFAEQMGQVAITVRDWHNQKHEGISLEVARGILEEIVAEQMRLLYRKWDFQDQVKTAETWEVLQALQAEYEGDW